MLQEVCFLRSSGMSIPNIATSIHVRTDAVKQILHQLSIPLPECSCRYCGKKFTPRDTLQVYCKSICRKNFWTRKWSEQNSKKEWGKKLEVIKILGGKCISCGNTDLRVLQMNHLNGGGSRELKSRGASQIRIDILKGKRMGEFDLRCANCNILYDYEKGRRKTHDRECTGS